MKPAKFPLPPSGDAKARRKRLIWALAICSVLMGLIIGLVRTPPENLTSASKASQPYSETQDSQPPSLSKEDAENACKKMGDEKEVKLVSYKVQEGDTLTYIARKFNTTVESITAINGLTSPDRITVDMELSIMQNASGTVRRVMQGDTLWDISRNYGISIEDIVKANALRDPDDLTPGQLLLLPGAKVTLGSVQVASSSRSSAFSWPLTGRITDGFGWRIHPITGKRHFHEGIDIAAPVGRPVRASAGGTVSFAGWFDGYGRLVIIKHAKGYETRYGHLSKYIVFKGQGYVGNTGLSTGPHLHFEIRVNGRAKNPRIYLP